MISLIATIADAVSGPDLSSANEIRPAKFASSERNFSLPSEFAIAFSMNSRLYAMASQSSVRPARYASMQL